MMKSITRRVVSAILSAIFLEQSAAVESSGQTAQAQFQVSLTILEVCVIRSDTTGGYPEAAPVISCLHNSPYQLTRISASANSARSAPDAALSVLTLTF